MNGFLDGGLRLRERWLPSLAQTLRDAGVVETTRGRMGGIRLIKAPDQINLGALARITEGDFALVQCMRGRGDAGCVIAPACRLKGVLTQALDAYLAVLDAHTLADLTANRTELAALFLMETQAA